MKPLPKNYEHKEAEARWQEYWEQAGVHAWDESQPRENTFVIDTPPPTVSGLLHMGHIFSYTQADFVARYQRMRGKTVFYPMGFDDNGLPTERLVEKVKKVRATDMSREDFITLCEGVAEEARVEFRKLFMSVALSVDWTQEYHTISDECRRISQMSFLDLHEKGEAYRKLQPMLWDPVDQTAIAQAEIVDKELPSHMNDIIFFVDSDERPRQEIVIATTRPELLAACAAVFYHPDDARYKHLKGKQAITPLFGAKVPILEDESVEMEKGTGIMMCCTFGDEKDIEKWRKHNLPTQLILNKYGKIDFSSLVLDSVQDAQRLAAFKEALTGLKAAVAREKTIELLKEHKVLVKQEAITHAVKCAERSGAPLEILPTQQWFVKVLDKKEALKAKAAECAWHPEYMRHRMDQWIDGLSWDWCISRQRYFGVPFPVWYASKYDGWQPVGEQYAIIADFNQLPVNPLISVPSGFEIKTNMFMTDSSKSEEEQKNMRDELKVKICEIKKDIYINEKLVFRVGETVLVVPEIDVMDTWATSSVSPQISSHGLNGKYNIDLERHAKLFPADVRPQAHEIIRTWAFYTIVKAHLHAGSIPWKNLMISGWCLAADKTKMSKSKGNVITPVELIVDKSADAVRYWTSTSRLGVDTAFSEDVLKIGRKLVTKLWNATNFAALHLSKLQTIPSTAMADVKAGVITEKLDLWILTRLKRAVEKATGEFEQYEYCDARVAVEDFFWNDFCDNYLELIKARAYGEEHGASKQAQMSAVHTLYHCLNGILRLFAPFVPHVTEELYSHIFDGEFAVKKSLHARGNWPQTKDYPCEEKAEQGGIAIKSLLNAIRKAKSERNVSIKFPIKEVSISSADKNIWALIEPLLFDLKGASNAASILWVEKSQGESIATEDGRFHLHITFGEQTEVA